MARPSKTAGPPVPIVRACTAVRLGALVGLLLGHASGGGTRGALFGDSCNGTTPLAEGLCCCAVSSLVAYGKQLTYLSSCADSSACTGNHTGFCAKRQHEGAPANWKLATNDFCQFVCPCCAGVPAGTVEGRRLGETPAQPRDLHQTARALGQEPQAPADGAAALAQFEEGGRFLKSARLSEQWVQEGAVALFDTSSSDFHKSLMGSVTANHTLQEFYDVKYGSPSWALLSKMRRAHNWDEGELAIFLYTTEWPQIYAPMNKLLREATSLEDIDEYWQSYMAILKHGLETYARYVEVDTWRGVSCDAVDALPVGSTGVLPSFTSTSTEHRVASSFGCTVLHFTGGGYDIQEYSHFPGEAEVLLEQGRSYRVTKGGEGERRLTLETPGPQVMKRPEITEAAGQVPITNCSRMDHSICPVCSCCQKAPRAILESLEASSPAPSPSRVPGDSLLAALGQRAAEVAPDMTAHEVARVLRAYGELGEQPGDRLLAALGWRATQVAGNMTARDVVDTFQAYARIGQPLGAPVLAAVERRAKAVAKQMNAPDVAIMLDSYAKLKAEENIPGPGSRG
mmetsp:Transcript_47209/g.150680  ORF Transcript_47209/g.150680 Transcript_47209/m.150680 type:complete len:569 (-) Transcript_47209:65-1771(-)